jgi:uracil-DNA glycosylase family 4
VDRKEKNKLKKYLLLQRDLGFEEFYFPESSRPRRKITVKRLGLDNFEESESVDQLEATIKRCKRCPLGKTRTKFVFGVGNPDADIMFIGEAPGRDEDMQGIPFVGRAGKLLDKMLAEIGLNRTDVYIANILKCRPPNNRDPEQDEVDQCLPYLMKQIKLIKPKAICSLGRIAAQRILKTNMALGAMRGRWFDYHGIKFMVTYHPAAILRSNSYLPGALEDLKRLVKTVNSLKAGTK